MKRVIILSALTAAALMLAMTGCNVTRTITSKSEYYQRGDTSCMIQTKTIESYDATKRLY